MPLTLMMITNDPQVARMAERSGIDWIFVDLEINGKVDRQGHLNTVISKHTIGDIAIIREAVTSSRVLVRVNPIFEGSMDEINAVVDAGAEIIMLPYFKTPDEVDRLVKIVNGRSQVCLLLETPEAVEHLDDILTIAGIDYVHIGLNDLHLGLGRKFMFELLADGTVEKLCKRIEAQDIAYGFGGIARMGEGALQAEHVIAEHYRLGSSMAILSRTFLSDDAKRESGIVESALVSDVRAIRDHEARLAALMPEDFELNRVKIVEAVGDIVGQMSVDTRQDSLDGAEQ